MVRPTADDFGRFLALVPVNLIFQLIVEDAIAGEDRPTAGGDGALRLKFHTLVGIMSTAGVVRGEPLSLVWGVGAALSTVCVQKLKN